MNRVRSPNSQPVFLIASESIEIYATKKNKNYKHTVLKNNQVIERPG